MLTLTCNVEEEFLSFLGIYEDPGISAIDAVYLNGKEKRMICY